MSVDDEVRSARRGAALFARDDRGVLEVRGGDARRWLNGMVTNDVAKLAESPGRSGCPALVLTNRGRVVADVQVLLVGDVFWLDLARAFVGPLRERLLKFVIADDVELNDRSAELARLGLEGPASADVLRSALGADVAGLAPDTCARVAFPGGEIVIARFGWSGEDAFQLFVPLPLAAALRARLAAAVPAPTAASAAALEVLRIEAGRPRLGAELSEEVLPPEARLEGSISYTKGCYTGQEIVARLQSRGHVNHRLVGLHFDGAAPPAGTKLSAGEREIGEITSVAASPHAGAIALGYARVGFDAPGTELRAGDATGRIAELPLVASGALP